MKQKVVEVKNGDEYVLCAKCLSPVNLRGDAWFDPYNKSMQYHKSCKGSQVHYDCLSEKRKKEIADERAKEKAEREAKQE